MNSECKEKEMQNWEKKTTKQTRFLTWLGPTILQTVLLFVWHLSPGGVVSPGGERRGATEEQVQRRQTPERWGKADSSWGEESAHRRDPQ